MPPGVLTKDPGGFFYKPEFPKGSCPTIPPTATLSTPEALRSFDLL